ncbi:MAG: FtsW/RodA/SpoVE family cell cycle protein [Bacteroidales bacterium]|nr:FtsW/RodA/SpoVE family cell cycle protein [Bacteroidales bacterium]
MAEDKQKKTIFNFVDSLEGDKVVWMIVMLLILFSIVAIFSSTSLLAVQQNTTRMKIISEQLLISLIGLVVITVCYNIKSIRFYRFLSQFGYVLSMGLLLILASHKPLGPIKPLFINKAWRIVSIAGVQIHVFEVVKVAMVMYLAWAVNAFRNDDFKTANLLARKHPVWAKPLTKKIVYIYAPIFTVCLGIMVGSLSSTLFIGGIMFLTILIGGIGIKELLAPAAVAVVLLGGCIGLNKIVKSHSEKVPFPHLESALKRLDSQGSEKAFEIMKSVPSGDIRFQEALDEVKQPVSAKIAIKEGGIIGKGPGKSTQRYVVPIMFEDYMFSFIVEEYGLIGGILVIILYISLLARGSLIVRNCDNHFAKTAVAGLVVLITGQAIMHIMINCDIGPLTGQTLPMISHGNSSFLMFSCAFGIILSISRMAKRKLDRAARKAVAESNARDDVRNRMDDLEQLENGALEGNFEEDGLTVHENDIPDYDIDDHNNE